jgi:hypothetical protein
VSSWLWARRQRSRGAPPPGRPHSQPRPGSTGCFRGRMPTVKSLDDYSYRELQALCKANGLRAVGSSVVLRRQLEAQPPPPESEDDGPYSPAPGTVATTGPGEGSAPKGRTDDPPQGPPSGLRTPTDADVCMSEAAAIVTDPLDFAAMVASWRLSGSPAAAAAVPNSTAASGRTSFAAGRSPSPSGPRVSFQFGVGEQEEPGPATAGRHLTQAASISHFDHQLPSPGVPPSEMRRLSSAFRRSASDGTSPPTAAPPARARSPSPLRGDGVSAVCPRLRHLLGVGASPSGAAALLLLLLLRAALIAGRHGGSSVVTWTLLALLGAALAGLLVAWCKFGGWGIARGLAWVWLHHVVLPRQLGRALEVKRYAQQGVSSVHSISAAPCVSPATLHAAPRPTLLW